MAGFSSRDQRLFRLLERVGVKGGILESQIAYVCWCPNRIDIFHVDTVHAGIWLGTETDNRLRYNFVEQYIHLGILFANLF